MPVRPRPLPAPTPKDCSPTGKHDKYGGEVVTLLVARASAPTNRPLSCEFRGSRSAPPPMRTMIVAASMEGERRCDDGDYLDEPSEASVHVTRRFEYKVIDTGKRIEEQLNKLGAAGWQVVGVTTKKQLLIAPPQAIILMREVQSTG